MSVFGPERDPELRDGLAENVETGAGASESLNADIPVSSMAETTTATGSKDTANMDVIANTLDNSDPHPPDLTATSVVASTSKAPASTTPAVIHHSTLEDALMNSISHNNLPENIYHGVSLSEKSSARGKKRARAEVDIQVDAEGEKKKVRRSEDNPQGQDLGGELAGTWIQMKQDSDSVEPEEIIRLFVVDRGGRVPLPDPPAVRRRNMRYFVERAAAATTAASCTSSSKPKEPDTGKRDRNPGWIRAALQQSHSHSKKQKVEGKEKEGNDDHNGAPRIRLGCFLPLDPDNDNGSTPLPNHENEVMDIINLDNNDGEHDELPKEEHPVSSASASTSFKPKRASRPRGRKTKPPAPASALQSPSTRSKTTSPRKGMPSSIPDVEGTMDDGAHSASASGAGSGSKTRSTKRSQGESSTAANSTQTHDLKPRSPAKMTVAIMESKGKGRGKPIASGKDKSQGVVKVESTIYPTLMSSSATPSLPTQPQQPQRPPLPNHTFSPQTQTQPLPPPPLPYQPPLHQQPQYQPHYQQPHYEQTHHSPPPPLLHNPPHPTRHIPSPPSTSALLYHISPLPDIMQAYTVAAMTTGVLSWTGIGPTGFEWLPPLFLKVPVDPAGSGTSMDTTPHQQDGGGGTANSLLVPLSLSNSATSTAQNPYPQSQSGSGGSSDSGFGTPSSLLLSHPPLSSATTAPTPAKNPYPQSQSQALAIIQTSTQQSYVPHHMQSVTPVSTIPTNPGYHGSSSDMGSSGGTVDTLPSNWSLYNAFQMSLSGSGAPGTFPTSSSSNSATAPAPTSVWNPGANGTTTTATVPNFLSYYRNVYPSPGVHSASSDPTTKGSTHAHNGTGTSTSTGVAIPNTLKNPIPLQYNMKPLGNPYAASRGRLGGGGRKPTHMTAKTKVLGTVGELKVKLGKGRGSVGVNGTPTSASSSIPSSSAGYSPPSTTMALAPAPIPKSAPSRSSSTDADAEGDPEPDERNDDDIDLDIYAPTIDVLGGSSGGDARMN